MRILELGKNNLAVDLDSVVAVEGQGEDTTYYVVYVGAAAIGIVVSDTDCPRGEFVKKWRGEK